MVRLNLVIELKSTIFAAKMFQAFMTRSHKNEERMLLWHFLNSLYLSIYRRPCKNTICSGKWTSSEMDSG